MNIKNIFSIRKLIFLFCIIFICYKIFNNIDDIISKIENNLEITLIIFLLLIVHHNFLSLRVYLIYKLCASYSKKYFVWSKLYFESISLNIFLSHSGSLYRANILKKQGVPYKSFIALFYILYLSYLLINLTYINFELLFFSNLDNQILILILIIILFLFFSLFFLLKILNFISKIRFLNKNFFLKKIKKIFDYIYVFIKESLNNKIIKILFSLVSLSHILELLLFYLSFNIFFPEYDIDIFFIFFAFSFILDRVPGIGNIPGLNEIIYAGVISVYGFIFLDAVLVKFLLRMIGLISILSNLLFYHVYNVISNK